METEFFTGTAVRLTGGLGVGSDAARGRGPVGWPPARRAPDGARRRGVRCGAAFARAFKGNWT